ncbi:MBL fold metallo-hydrolase [Gabonibacter chumensis]|uniref:MBL fold metallo-hydrolase n=1 Tax=Gabonibacter chumensis TaxID=2972474 RepID=UPI0025747529|nr:MBL fold metallo-hydrolase [Gabonibacter chumensis]MCR9012816.1 MBL fold metallo-hydrolase [Gabonibacter chumensis]
MVQIKRIINSPVASNCYIVSLPYQNDCIVVDPGTPDPVSIVSFCLENNLKPEYAILTHEHYDHCIGYNELKRYYPDIKLICSSVCAQNIRLPEWNLSKYAENVMPTSIHEADIRIEDTNHPLNWNNRIIRFFLTKGHSKGSICFSIDEKFLFTGDTLIPGFKTITKLKGGSKEELSESLNRLSNYFKGKESELIVYPGHGECVLFKEINHKD